MNEIELKILIGLHRNANIIDRKTIKLLSDYGLSLTQFAVMEALYSKGDMSVGKVRDIVLSTAGTIPLVADNLVKRGYIRRRSDEKDRRVSILSLTEIGLSVIEKVVPLNVEMIKEHMEVLSFSEKEQLLKILKKLGGK